MNDETSSRRTAATRLSRLLVPGLFLLMLIQVGAAVRIFTLPSSLADSIANRLSLPVVWDSAISAVWAAAFAWIVSRILRHDTRANRWSAYLVASFGVYTVGRLVIFVQADYDRARLPLLGVSVLVLSLLLAAYLHGVRR
ncbi:MAG: hypothetical protein U0670_10375 [Anaerolineae bacterium]